MSAPKKTSVLFVCLGNICRSPMCEAVFAHVVQTRGLGSAFNVDSAATSSYHIGDAPDTRSVATCRKHGVPVNHRGRKITIEDFHKFDYIFCMDKSNLSDLCSIQPADGKAVLRMFGEYDPKGEKIIEDPYYGSIHDFEHNFEQAMRCTNGFLESLGHHV